MGDLLILSRLLREIPLGGENLAADSLRRDALTGGAKAPAPGFIGPARRRRYPRPPAARSLFLAIVIARVPRVEEGGKEVLPSGKDRRDKRAADRVHVDTLISK